MKHGVAGLTQYPWLRAQRRDWGYKTLTDIRVGASKRMPVLPRTRNVGESASEIARMPVVALDRQRRIRLQGSLATIPRVTAPRSQAERVALPTSPSLRLDVADGPAVARSHLSGRHATPRHGGNAFVEGPLELGRSRSLQGVAGPRRPLVFGSRRCEFLEDVVYAGQSIRVRWPGMRHGWMARLRRAVDRGPCEALGGGRYDVPLKVNADGRTHVPSPSTVVGNDGGERIPT